MTDRITGLERLAQLKAEGVLTDEEFTAQKAALLGTSDANLWIGVQKGPR